MAYMLNKLRLDERSYIIGLLQGDGSLSSGGESKGSMSYEISIRDADMVYKLNSLLSPYVYVSISERNRSTNFKDDYDSITLGIFNREFRSELAKVVPPGKKSTKIAPPKNVSARDYIRGLIDADGSIGLTNDDRCFIGLCTSSDSIKDYMLASILDIAKRRKTINRNKRDGVYNIVLFDEDAQLYAQYLYKDACIYIDRKNDKYEEIMRWERNPNKRRVISKSWIQSDDDIVLSCDLSVEEKMAMLDRTSSSIKTRMWRLRKKG